MITDYEIDRTNSQILLGIATEHAVLDLITTDELLQNCIELLHKPHRGLVHTKLGNFGAYDVTLNLSHDDTTSIVVDGPYISQARNLSAGIYLDKIDLLKLLNNALNLHHKIPSQGDDRAS